MITKWVKGWLGSAGGGRVLNALCVPSTEATGSVPIYDAFTCALAALGSASGTSETAGSSTVYATVYALHLSLHLELLVLLPLPLVVVLVQLLHLLNQLLLTLHLDHEGHNLTHQNQDLHLL